MDNLGNSQGAANTNLATRISAANSGNGSATPAATGTENSGSALEKVTVNGEVFELQPEAARALRAKMSLVDSHLGKQSQAIAEERRALATERAQINETLKKLEGMAPKANTQSNLSPEAQQEAAAREIVRQIAIEEAQKLLGKTQAELDEIKKGRDEDRQSSSAKETILEAKQILDGSPLTATQKQRFLYQFMGEFDVTKMYADDTVNDRGQVVPGVMTLLRQRLRAETKELETSGLLSNKKYVDKKEEIKKKYGTDNKGSTGVGGNSKAPTKVQQKQASLNRLSTLVKARFPGGI